VSRQRFVVFAEPSFRAERNHRVDSRRVVDRDEQRDRRATNEDRDGAADGDRCHRTPALNAQSELVVGEADQQAMPRPTLDCINPMALAFVATSDASPPMRSKPWIAAEDA
jgi:hypothetical protein